jgi:hypothetical protein
MIRSFTYLVKKDSPFFKAGTILVTSVMVDSSNFELKGSRDVTRSFFPLLGMLKSGTVREFKSWEDLEHEFESDSFRAEDLRYQRSVI